MMLDIAATFCPKVETYQGNKINVTGKHCEVFTRICFLHFIQNFAKSIYMYCVKPTGFYSRVSLLHMSIIDRSLLRQKFVK